MIDHLDRDLAGLGLLKGVGGRRVQGAPGGLIDLGPQGALQFFVRLVGAGKVGVANDEGFLVVVGVDEPAGNVVGGVGAHFASGRVVNVQAFKMDSDLAVLLYAAVNYGPLGISLKQD